MGEYFWDWVGQFSLLVLYCLGYFTFLKWILLNVRVQKIKLLDAKKVFLPTINPLPLVFLCDSFIFGIGFYHIFLVIHTSIKILEILNYHLSQCNKGINPYFWGRQHKIRYIFLCPIREVVWSLSDFFYVLSKHSFG